MHHTTRGSGTPVVLLHGFCEDSRIWDDWQQLLLDAGLQVVTIDLPGFGQSTTEPRASIRDMAAMVVEVLDSLLLEKVVLVGHSMGGYVGLAFAEAYADRLLGLSLFHSHPYADTPDIWALREKSIAFIKRYGHALYVKQTIPNIFAPRFRRDNTFLLEKLSLRAVQYPSDGLTTALAAMAQRPDRSQVLSELEVPVQMIVGSEDQTLPPEKSIQQLALPIVADVQILSGVGHAGMLEAPAVTAKQVIGFVDFCAQNTAAA